MRPLETQLQHTRFVTDLAVSATDLLAELRCMKRYLDPERYEVYALWDARYLNEAQMASLRKVLVQARRVRNCFDDILAFHARVLLSVRLGYGPEVFRSLLADWKRNSAQLAAMEFLILPPHPLAVPIAELRQQIEQHLMERFCGPTD